MVVTLLSLFPVSTFIALKTIKSAGWEVHVGRTTVPYFTQPSFFFFFSKFCFLISSKWSLFCPPLVYITIVTSWDYRKFKLKGSHFYDVFPSLEIPSWRINFIWIFRQWKSNMQVCTWSNWRYLNIPLCTYWGFFLWTSLHQCTSMNT